VKRAIMRRAASVAGLCLLAAAAHAQGAPEAPARHPDLSQVFVFFFLMLGPIKIVGPFVRITRALDDAARRQLAIRAFLISSASTVIAAIIGHTVLQNWHVSLGALLLAGGVVLFLVALTQVLQQYASPSPEAIAAGDGPGHAADAARIAFPTVVTPYGIAVVIIVLATSPGLAYGIAVIAILLGVMLLNLLAMLYARQILGTIGIMPLQVLGAVLSVLQVALGVQMILWALAMLGIFEGTRF
jgi:multiple antibiotic resistance protein